MVNFMVNISNLEKLIKMGWILVVFEQGSDLTQIQLPYISWDKIINQKKEE